MAAEDCFARGNEVGNMLVQIREFSRSGTREQVMEAAKLLKDKIQGTACVVPQLKEKVGNELDALENFARARDAAGVEQAIELLRTDFGIAPMAEKVVRPRVSEALSKGGLAPTAPAAPKVLGYRVTVDGTTELKFVPKRDSMEAFEAFSSLFPGRKVELVPIEG